MPNARSKRIKTISQRTAFNHAQVIQTHRISIFFLYFSIAELFFYSVETEALWGCLLAISGTSRLRILHRYVILFVKKNVD